MGEEKVYTREELENKLTQKENIFCHEYIIDWNKSRAARAAGYSEDSCANIGWENVKKPHIIQYIDFIKNDFEKEAGISKVRNLQELAKIAYSNIEYIHDSWIDLSDWEKIKEENPSILAAIESIDTKVEKRTAKDEFNRDCDIEIHYVKVKLYPKITAIQEINRMMGYNAPSVINTNITMFEDFFDDDK